MKDKGQVGFDSIVKWSGITGSFLAIACNEPKAIDGR